MGIRIILCLVHLEKYLCEATDSLVDGVYYLSSWGLILTLLLLNKACPVLANSADPDQLASEEANWSGSALFVIKYVNFHQKPGSSNLIGWKLEVGMAS